MVEATAVPSPEALEQRMAQQRSGKHIPYPASTTFSGGALGVRLAGDDRGDSGRYHV